MLKKLKSVGLFLLFLATAGNAFALSGQTAKSSVVQQESQCKGVVKDTTGETIIGATVKIKNTTSGTITNADGEFILPSAKKGDVLVISFMGYATKEVTYEGQPLDVTLNEDSKNIGEVVVTALGINKQARSVGYATTKVSTDEIERTNAINPVNALQGKVAGVQINSGGASGLTSSSSITIRGAKSVSKNNSPIFVVDGMIIQENLTGNLAGTDWGSQLKNLNPADYESVTVLKGAAATSLYGSRGANGAIIIVTKSGMYGKDGLGVEVSQVLEWTNVYKSPIDLQNVYGAGRPNNGTQGGFMADGTLQKTALSWGPRMDGQLINQYLPSGVATPFVAQPDNWKDLYKTGLTSTTTAAISGGGKNSSFRLAYGYTDNTGIFARNEFNRHNITFKGITELNRIFSVEMGAMVAFSEIMNPPSQGGWDWANNAGMITAYSVPRNYDIAAHEAQYRDPETHAVESTSGFSTLSTYLHNRDTKVNKRNEQSILADVTLRAKIAPWLDASVKANYNYYNINSETKEYGTGVNYGPTGTGYYGRSGETTGSYNFLGMLQSSDNTFKIGSEEISVSAILAAELYGNTAKNTWAKSTNGGLVVPGVFAFSNSVNKIEPTFSYTPRNSQLFGLSAIVNLAWRDQLFLELTGRNDWMSTLTYPNYVAEAKNNYTVFYPSANASWVFTDTFKENMPEWFSFGKLRASISRVGMGTSAYQTVNGYGVYNQGAIYLPDRSGSVLSGTANLGTAFNNNLKPEIQQSIELGTDLRFFDERFTIDFAYYKTNTHNQILSLASVAESGASSMLINAGNIQNQGIEIQMDVTPIRTADWRWTVGGNFTLNRGKVKKLNEYAKEWQLMGGYDAAPEIWAYEGGDFGVLTSYQNSSYMSPIATFQGESGDPRNGKMIIKYDNEYGTENTVSMYSPLTYYERNGEGDRDRQILGKIEADFTLSLNTSVSWKDFDLFIQGDGRFGGNYFSNVWKYASPMGTLKSSLVGRDAANGGIPRINYEGVTVNDGLMLDAVFAEGTQAPTQNADGSVGPMVDVGGMTYADAVAEKNIRPVMTSAWYLNNYGWGMAAMPGSIQDNTWFCLREITLGYRVPENICKKFGANYLRLGFTARNICYIINKLSDGLNPAGISSNNPLQPMDIGGVPFSRTFAVNLTVRF